MAPASNSGLADADQGASDPAVVTPAQVEDRGVPETLLAAAHEAQQPTLVRHAGAQTGSRAARNGVVELGAAGLHGPAAAAAAGTELAVPAHNPGFVLREEQALPGSAASGGPVASREMFAALDGEASAAGPRWVHAGAQHAEAGFQDPALGWVGIRAAVGVGGVHATIVPGSADAAQVLGGHLAHLHAHLAAQEIPVQSLSLSGSGEGQGAEFGQGSWQQGAWQQGAGHPGRGGEQGSEVPAPVRHGEADQHSAANPGEGVPVAAHGTYISVVA